MTAMCDVSFLLLTFFMLTSKFRPPEPVNIDLPNSRSQIKLDKTMVISVDKNGAAYFTVSNEIREPLLNNILEAHPEIKLTKQEMTTFKGIEMIGFPFAEMQSVLDMNLEEYKNYQQKGIPKDSANNQLYEWVLAARYADPYLKISVKGDKNSSIVAIKQVMRTLTEKAGIHTFNVITTLAGNSQRANTTTGSNVQEPKQP